jgi:signal transduction histidine kinase
VLRRYLSALNESDLANVLLERRLTERTRELEDSHRKLRAVEQERVLVDERQRLMRDMHDGLGSTLMSSLVMVEQGRLNAGEVAAVLRESIDDLKLTIDSMEPMEDDLLTLLGTLRYRLGPRLQVAGIKLEWKIRELPALTWLNPVASLHILRILQEAITNILKHAKAKSILVETASENGEIAIHLTDDGVGFAIEVARLQTAGRGLQNMEARARNLNGTIDVESRPGRTTLVLRLPLTQQPDAG